MKSQARWLYGILTVLLILFVGLRFHTGADWSNYHQMFDRSLSGNPFNIEYGFLLLNRVFKIVFDNYYVMQFAITAFVGIALYRLYKHNSDYPIVSLHLIVWILLFNILMAQVRQSIAMAIIVFALPYIFERKPIHFFTAIFLASFFHISAIVAILLYFMYRNFGKIIPVVVMVAAQFFYFFPGITEKFILFITPYLPGRLSNLAEVYVDSIYAEQAEFGTGIFYIIITTFSIFLVSFITPKDKKQAFFLNTLAVFIIIRGFAIGFEIISRFEAYFVVFAVIAYTYFFDLRIKRLRSIYLITACFILLFFGVPAIRAVQNTNIDAKTGRPANYALVPYYNVLWHPPEASQRRDGWQQ